VGCPEEVAYRMGYIDASWLRELGQGHGSSPYGRYLRDLAERDPAHSDARR